MKLNVIASTERGSLGGNAVVEILPERGFVDVVIPGTDIQLCIEWLDAPTGKCGAVDNGTQQGK